MQEMGEIQLSESVELETIKKSWPGFEALVSQAINALISNVHRGFDDNDQWAEDWLNDLGQERKSFMLRMLRDEIEWPDDIEKRIARDEFAALTLSVLLAVSANADNLLNNPAAFGKFVDDLGLFDNGDETGGPAGKLPGEGPQTEPE